MKFLIILCFITCASMANASFELDAEVLWMTCLSEKNNTKINLYTEKNGDSTKIVGALVIYSDGSRFNYGTGNATLAAKVSVINATMESSSIYNVVYVSLTNEGDVKDKLVAVISAGMFFDKNGVDKIVCKY